MVKKLKIIKKEKPAIKIRPPDIKSLIFGTNKAINVTSDSRSLFLIRDIRDGIIITEDNRYIKVLEANPVNFYLKSRIEQQNIIYYFSSYLKIAPSNLQVIVQTGKANIDAYCENMERFYNSESNENCREMILENAALINYLADNEAVSRRFFLVFSYEGGSSNYEEIVKTLYEQEENAAAYLENCGLEIIRQEDNTAFLNSFIFNTLNKTRAETENFSCGNDILSEIKPKMDLTPKDHIVVDGAYHSYLYITGYGYTTKNGLAWMAPLVEAGDGISFSFLIKKQRRDKILPKIIKTTMINRSRMREVDDTRVDFEQIDDAIASGMYMKDEMNRNGEEFYYMHTVIEVTADNMELLQKRLSYVETMMGSMDMAVKRASYKQKEAFLSLLPLLYIDPDLERPARRNILTYGAAASFPFSSFELCDQRGVLLGINQYNNSAVIVDFFNSQKYSNANLSIMGMSGAGKTFLLQLLTLRLRMQGTQVFIIAPLKGWEFRKACEAIGGKYIKLSPGSADCINIMEIRRKTLDTGTEGETTKRNDSVLADKVQKLHIFFSLLHPEMSTEEKHLLDNAIIETYHKFGITHDNASLESATDMPTLTDLYNTLSESVETRNLSLILSRLVKGSASRLGGKTNVDLNNKYIVLDISEMGKELLPLGMFLALDFVWDEAKKSRITKKAVCLDEVWELIGSGANELAADFVLEIFKIIRGLGGMAVAATQDLVDFFALQDGKYGKGILNNCRTKIILPLEEDEALAVKKYLSLSDEETMQIIRNGRGQGLLCSGRNRISVEFKSCASEHSLITTAREDLEAAYIMDTTPVLGVDFVEGDATILERKVLYET